MTVKWTDQQLRDAIGVEKSWHGVARRLGYAPTSSGAIRKMKSRAKELDVSFAHFTAQRRWTDHQLATAIRGALTWSDVALTLGLSASTELVSRFRGVAQRLGIDATHLDPMPARSPALDNIELRPSSIRLRDAAESPAVAWFTLHNLEVALPSGPMPYDLVVTFPSGMKRVQVKSSTFRGRHGSWHVGIGKRPYVLDKSASRTAYDPNELDYFFVIDGLGHMYLVPIAAVAGRTTMSVGGYQKYLVGDCSSLLSSFPTQTFSEASPS